MAQHDPSQLMAQIEALLFIYGEPIDAKKLAKNLGVSEADVRTGLAALEQELTRSERGLALVEDKGKVQLVTKPAFSKMLESITKQEFSESLTPAALETLSIISYAGPISRADIEYIRGVNSSFIVRTLLMRGLVERATDPKRANSYLYSTSFELLRHLGLSKNIDLPEYQKYHDLVLHMHDELQQKDAAQQAIDLPPADATIPAEPSSLSDAPDQQAASDQPQP
ncbi:SMC-Scp complex subunit ScpB [Patescibacteria group bacterium]|nr:SMC-Scp complex subunit ScpB [Patescibacteria group bacterium]